MITGSRVVRVLSTNTEGVVVSQQITVFVASSSEQIATAEGIARALSGTPELDVQVWNKGVFDFSASYMESLEKVMEQADFAVVVLTADDRADVRGEAVQLPRDNVNFELGLFVGGLGRERCFFFIDGASRTRIASDLSGIEPVTFYPAVSNQPPGKPTLEAQGEKVRARMLTMGARYKPGRQIRGEQEGLWRFSQAISGYWWERMRKGEDDMSAISYLRITVDPVTNSPCLVGRSFDRDGRPMADWHSVATGVAIGGSPAVYYRWEGQVEEETGQIYGGGGRFIFDDLDLNTARGYFYDTNFALLKGGGRTRIKRFGMYRVSTDEEEIMKTPWSAHARRLVRKQLKKLKGR